MRYESTLNKGGMTGPAIPSSSCHILMMTTESHLSASLSSMLIIRENHGFRLDGPRRFFFLSDFMFHYQGGRAGVLHFW